MSAHGPPPSQPPPLPPPEQMIRPRNIRGNVAGTWGHVMRPPGSDTLRRQYEERARGAGDEAAVETDNDKERQRLALALEFEESTRAKQMHGQAKALAQASMRAVHLDLLRRRDQLRALLAAEGEEAEGELSERAARSLVDRLQEARSQAARLKERTEQERVRAVEAALERRDRERIEPLRTAERAALTVACKQVNLGQMRDRDEQREARREEERLAHALHVKTLRAQMAREEAEACEELARKKALCDALQRQVEYQQQRQDRAKEEEMADGVARLARLREELHQERLAGLARRREQRSELQRLFAEQIAQRERALAEQADREQAVDEAMARSARRQIEEERADRSKADAAAEMKMFLAHVAALRRQQEVADLEEQRIRDEHAAELRRQQDERRCRADAARKRMLQDTLAGRRQQLEAAQTQRALQAQEAAAEARRVEVCREENMQLAQQLRRRKEEERRQYASDLQQQIKYQQLLKERQMHEARLEREHARQEEERYQERVKQLLQNPQKYKTHPFRLKMEGKALSWPE